MSKQVLIMPLPPGALGSYAVAGKTGSMPFTLAATDIIFAFQWTNADRYAVIDSVTVSSVVSATITTGVVTGLELVPVRDFWNAYTTGTSLLGSVTTHEKKLKSNFTASLAADIRIANTLPLDLPLVPGIEDDVPIGQVIFGTETAAGVTILAQTPLFERATNSYPFVLDTNEGFVVRMALDGPATGNLRFNVTTQWMEIRKQHF
jgi:hypothetical protein